MPQNRTFRPGAITFGRVFVVAAARAAGVGACTLGQFTPGGRSVWGLSNDDSPVRMVFCAPGSYGHLYPLMPLALACAEAGHDVTVATNGPFVGRLPLPAVRSLPGGVELAALRASTVEAHPGLALDTVEGMLRFGGFMFGETLPRATAPVLVDVFTELRAELVVYDCNDIGAAIAAQVVGVRAVAFGVGAHTELFQSWHRVAAAGQRERWGPLPSLGDYSGGFLDPFPLSFYWGGTVPPHRLPVRTVAWDEGGELPTLRAGRRRVYVTLGTMAFGAVEVLRDAVLGVAAHDVDVVVAVGPGGDRSLLGELPANVTAATYLPQAAVLGSVDLVVHHGGAGTVLGALEYGLPQLLLPQGADQPLNAKLVARNGLGRVLVNEVRTVGGVTEAVGALLADGPVRVAAKRVAEEIAAMPSVADVARRLGDDV